MPGDEGGAPRRAARLGVERGQAQAFLADPVDVRRRHAHQVAAVGRDVEPADVVAEDDEDVRLGRLLRGGGGGKAGDRQQAGERGSEATKSEFVFIGCGVLSSSGALCPDIATNLGGSL